MNFFCMLWRVSNAETAVVSRSIGVRPSPAKALSHAILFVSVLDRYAHMTMKLIGTRTSPYVRKPRIVLMEKKIDCDFVIASTLG